MIAALHYLTLPNHPRIHTATLVGTEDGRRIFNVGGALLTEGVDCTVTDRHSVNVEEDARVDLAEGEAASATPDPLIVEHPIPDRFMGRLRMEGVGECSDVDEEFWTWIGREFRGGL